MAKKELFKNKLFGAVLKGLGGYPVDREHPSPSVYKNLVDTINNNLDKMHRYVKLRKKCLPQGRTFRPDRPSYKTRR